MLTDCLGATTLLGQHRARYFRSSLSESLSATDSSSPFALNNCRKRILPDLRTGMRATAEHLIHRLRKVSHSSPFWIYSHLHQL